MATFLTVWLIVHIALVIAALFLVGRDIFSAGWRSAAYSLAFIFVAPALVLAFVYAFSRYEGGWI